MIQYSISDLEKITGIKAHTIRVWERRYNLIEPQRTETNIRFYCQKEMQKLLDVVLLYNQGLKISQIAAMTQKEREEMMAELSEQDNAIELRKDCMIASVLEFNEEKFLTIFDNYENQFGLIDALKKFIWPFIENTSLLYVSGAFNLAHENFIQQIIKRRLQARVDQISSSECEKGQVLIFLPQGENQVLYTATMEYACRRAGYKTINLGRNIGFEELEMIAENVELDLVLTVLDTEFKEMAVVPYIQKIKSIFPDSQLVVSGYQAYHRTYESIQNVIVLRSPADVVDMFIDSSKNEL